MQELFFYQKVLLGEHVDTLPAAGDPGRCLSTKMTKLVTKGPQCRICMPPKDARAPRKWDRVKSRPQDGSWCDLRSKGDHF